MNTEKIAECKRRSEEAWNESERLWRLANEAVSKAREGNERWYQAEREYRAERDSTNDKLT